MKKSLLCTPLLLMVLGGRAFGQNVPTCNSFDASGAPIYSTANPPDQTGTANCTDYFGVANYANSPLPAGSISTAPTGATIISSGGGYNNPIVVISDPTGTGAQGTAIVTSGMITSVSFSSGGSNYIAPQISIVDVGPGGTLAAPTCGGANQVACGSGALVTAALTGPFSGGMRKFQDALKNLPVAVADTTTFPGSDFYVIGLMQYRQQMHSSLLMTTLRGYCQLTTPTYTTCAAGQPQYLGPLILATKNRPVRVLFKNMLPTGSGGNLFIPVDTTYMGADASYTQNRATLHLHGGNTPWISDGTPHQWTTPIGEPVPAKGASTRSVPDMWFDASGNLIPSCAGLTTCSTVGATNNPGPGAMTFYWTNQQGGRLMFYHDHAYGITRLNVYAGEAAGYLLTDPADEDYLASLSVPGTVGSTPVNTDLAHLIPLVIQDKTFVPSQPQLQAEDPTWIGNFGATQLSGTGSNGDLWFPHVYIPNQDPADAGGGNAFGRWDYGPWFFPPQTSLTAANPPTAVTIPCTSAAFPGQILSPSVANNSQFGCPITPNPSGTPESFMDTPVVNGVAYPVLHVAPAAYRFQILSAGNDRSWNLGLYVADSTQGNTEVAMLPSVLPAAGTALPLCPQINPITQPGLSLGLATALLDVNGNPLNGTGLPVNCWPNYGIGQPGIPLKQAMWPADGRVGGVPDPRTAGPPFIQIGTEGGLLPAPVVIPSTPTNYEYNTRSITVLNVGVHGLWLGPAERADVIVDFTQFAGKTLILYNDAPAPAPGFDSRLDYYTGDKDQTMMGGAPTTQPGYGPNTRTIMQIVVDATTPTVRTFSLPALTAGLSSLFNATQPAPIVPEPTYPPASGGNSPTATYASISDTSITYTPPATQPAPYTTVPCSATAPQVCVNYGQKTIQELFTLDYGRMNATLGVELPLTNFLTQTTIPYGYVDPPTEIVRDGETQFWKITHNGVDTHFIHFHLWNVQVINRIGWDGSKRPPDENELGWKDTVRMNPLEDIVVALQPKSQTLPWPVPDSIRNLDVTSGMPTFTNVNPNNNPDTVTNGPVNMGWEYVWHCHILGHEENDMMRPVIFQVAPPAPSAIKVTAAPGGLSVSFTDNSASESYFTVQRALATDPTFTTPTTFTVPASVPNTAFGGTITMLDNVPGNGPYLYRVRSEDDFTPNVDALQTTPAAAGGFPVPQLITSPWTVLATPASPVPVASVAPASLAFGAQPLNITATKVVTLSNNGSLPLTIASIAVTGNFGQTNTCGGTLNPGLSCAISVTFTPNVTGAQTGSLTITDNSNGTAGSTQIIPLSGMGTALQISPSTLSFGNQQVGLTSAPQTVTIKNVGATAITFTSITWSANFSGTQNCTPGLAAGQTCTVTVSFAPALTAVGPQAGVLTLTYSDPASPQTVALSGTGFSAPLQVTGIRSNVTFPATVGTSVTWTAAASGGVAPYTYQFWYFNVTSGVWTIGQAYSSSNTWTASLPAGTYSLQVWVRNAGSTASYDAWASSSQFTISPAQPLTVTSLRPNVTFPATVGTPVTWTAAISGGTAPYSYQFWYYNVTSGVWTIGQAYSATNTWTASLPAGTYSIQVWVRNAGSTASYDAWASSSQFTISPAQPLAVTGLSPNVTFPAAAGTPVTWTATVSGGTAPYTYQFWYYNVTSGVWTNGQAYSSSNTWTASLPAGTYSIQVWVRNAGSTTQYDAWASSNQFTIGTPQPPLTITGLTSNVTFPATLGTPVTWTATVSGGTAPYTYEFWFFNVTSGVWTIGQAYGSSNTWTVSLPAGTYSLQVWVRNAGSIASYDAWRSSTQFVVQ